ncbi:uncharacterized protein LOC129596091 [Paramacrobiotus metropolitanus]|uniref:uncharacterized protein LOC129596091 n=1 Tax=Paramacrobiotus metropolitanus TaxID=2943436 RepID=UPI0024458430|nr:uncharacterized protein LOC129596091 [Paramacrobiotus metropolitanus]
METKKTTQDALESRSFAVGDLVMSFDPFVWVMERSAYKTRCAYCLQESQELQTCSGCKLHRYCSVECQTADWKVEHKTECALLMKIGLGTGIERKPDPSGCGIRFSLDVPTDLIAKIVNKIKLNAVTDVIGLGLKSAKEMWDMLPSNPKFARMDIKHHRGLDVMQREFGLDLPEMETYAAKIGYNIMNIVDMPIMAPIGMALFPPVSPQLMTPVCWDVNVVLSFRGRRLFLRAVEDIPNYTGLKDLRCNEIMMTDPFSLTRAGRRTTFKNLHGYPCTCRKCTTQYEAEINPLKCTTVGCTNRIPSDERALQPCAECGALNSKRLAEFRCFMEDHEEIMTGFPAQLHTSMTASLLEDVDAADILQPDAHFRYVCGWELPRKLFDENRFEEGWKLMQELIVCSRNIYPKYNVSHAMELSLAGVSAASALKNRVLERIKQLNDEEKKQLKTMTDSACPVMLDYCREARDIFVMLYGEESKGAVGGNMLLARTEGFVRQIEQAFRGRQ